MSSKGYQLSVPEWLWDRWKHTVDDLGDYDRYNDRVLEHMIHDVQQNGGFDTTEEQRATILLSDLGGDNDAE